MKKLRWIYPRSLSQQLLVGFGVSVTTVGLATLGINYHLIEADLAQEVRDQAQSITRSLEFATEGLLEVKNSSILRRVVQNYATLPGAIEIAIVNPDGSLLARSPGNQPKQAYAAIYPELAQELEQAATSGVETSYQKILNGKPVIVGIMPFESTIFRVSNRRGMAIAILDLKQMKDKAWRTFYTSTVTLFVGSLAILVVMGLLIEITVLRPLRQVNEAVTDSNGTGHFAIPPTLPDNEIRFLATQILEAIVTRKEAYEQLQNETVQRQHLEEAHQKLAQTLRELQQTQTQMIQSEKMSALGNLVAGVAHEINNPVGFIAGNLKPAQDYVQDLFALIDLYQQKIPEPDAEIAEEIAAIDLEFIREDLPKLIQSMQEGTDRIKHISTSLRTFSRGDSDRPTLFNLHDGIDSTLLILKHRLKVSDGRPAIVVIKHYGNLPEVNCFAGQLNQVFMNILSNAIDAIDDGIEKGQIFKPCIHIYTEVVEKSVAIRIKDNAMGMTAEVQSQIFDHLFTTKGVGKGTGLGLAIARQIIEEKHQGSISVHSEIGVGTEFIISLSVK
jgi:signal transduction histidine kinase